MNVIHWLMTMSHLTQTIQVFDFNHPEPLFFLELVKSQL